MEKDLFGVIGSLKKKASREAVVLQKPKPETIRLFTDWLMQYTVPQLELVGRPILKALKEKDVSVVTAAGKKADADEISVILERKGVIRKQLWLDFLAFFLGSSHNLFWYMSTLSAPMRKVWEKVAMNYYVSCAEVSTILGKESIQKDTIFYSYSPLPTDELSGFFYLTEGRTGEKGGFGCDMYEYYFALTEVVAQTALTYFFPDLVRIPDAMEDLPQVEEMHTFSAETCIFQELPVLEGLNRCKKLPPSKNKLAANLLKRAAKTANLKEFFPGEAGDSLARATFVLTCFSFYRNSISEKLSPEDLIAELMKMAVKHAERLFSMVLPYLTGFKSFWMGVYIPEQAQAILDTLVKLKDKGWIEVTNFCTLLRVADNEANRRSFLFGEYGYKLQFTNSHTGEFISLDKLYREVGMPFVKRFLIFLSAWGVVEMAYHYPKADESYCFDQVRYVRLTALGRYVLGIDKEYEAPASKAFEPNFELDEDNLIIRSLQKDSPFESVLADMAVLITPGRYKVTPASFLKNCDSVADITNKIKLFKQCVCAKPPRNWATFFSRLKQNSTAIDELAEMPYRVFHVDPDDKELQRILFTDPEIRKYTIRAERYLLLIENAYVRKVFDRLKAFGYLL